MADLHERLRFRIDVLLEIARAATPGPWEYATVRGVTSVGAPGVLPSVVTDVHFDGDVHYLATFNPAAVIAWLEGELEVLERHHGYVIPAGQGNDHGRWNCNRCNGIVWPCDEIRSLAHRLGVSVDG